MGEELIYDLERGGPGNLNWGPLAINDGSTHRTLVSPLGQTLTWNFETFASGATFGFQADVDAPRDCRGRGTVYCRILVDAVSPPVFVAAGTIDVSVHINGKPFHFLAANETWNITLSSASTTYSDLTGTPEPAT